MNHYPHVRAMIVCPQCRGAKDPGLVVCWPCHRQQKRDNDGGYSPYLSVQLEQLEYVLAVTNGRAK